MPDPVTPSAFIIIPVHNRRAITLACLRNLHTQDVPTWAVILVVDDGSTDGTAEAIRTEFPSVELLNGDGQLWWTGAIALGMTTALRRQADCIIWLNDDCEPSPGTLTRLRDTACSRQAIVGGMCRIPGSTLAVYGGYRRQGTDLFFIEPIQGALVACDALSGHIVCVPRQVIERLGLPDARHLPQAWGDFDYCLRAQAAGFTVLVDGEAVAWSAPNNLDNLSSWLLGDISIWAIWSSLGHKNAYAYLPAHARFLTRHFGWRGALRCGWLIAKRLPITIAKLLIPLAYRRRWWGARSVAWQNEQRVRAALRLNAR